MKIQERPAGKAGRRDAAQNVRAGQADDTKPRTKPASTFIQLDEQYALAGDAQSWHVFKRCDRTDGCRWEPILWYGTLEQCSNALADRAVRTSGAKALADALAECNRVTSAICRMLRPIKVEMRR